jgi:cysteine synthase A
MLDQRLAPGLPIFERLNNRVVYVLSYDGNTSPLATSILRHKGIEAYAVKGGIVEWRNSIAQ